MTVSRLMTLHAVRHIQESRYGGNQSPNHFWCQASRMAYDLVLA